MGSRILEGIVVSDKNIKTVVVLVVRRTVHPMYGKIVKVHKKYHAHDENDTCKIGDAVRIISSRPISKLKKWSLLKKLSSSGGIA